jgi:hypothetical protein
MLSSVRTHDDDLLLYPLGVLLAGAILIDVAINQDPMLTLWLAVMLVGAWVVFGLFNSWWAHSLSKSLAPSQPSDQEENAASAREPFAADGVRKDI